jgi:succinyl-diaminopimelate desuccinylase
VAPETFGTELLTDPVALTGALVDIESVSGHERRIADVVANTLHARAPSLQLARCGEAVLARTNLGRQKRVVFAGHLDTVPVNANLPSTRDGEKLYGCGACDMKGGLAVMLHLASTLTEPQHDLTFVFYDCEEVEAARNGLGRIERETPEWLDGDLAVVCEPTGGVVAAGCQGTMRVELATRGERAHTARAWMGSNAIHAASEPLARLAAYQPRTVTIDGCDYREGLQAVRLAGGVGGNVVPDECVLTVNYRFAPDRDEADARAHLREVFDGYPLEVTDCSRGALPRLDEPGAAELVAALDAPPEAKLGWTDVARFAARGVPAVNFGPGDPLVAHTRREHVAVPEIWHCAETLRRFLRRIG